MIQGISLLTDILLPDLWPLSNESYAVWKRLGIIPPQRFRCSHRLGSSISRHRNQMEASKRTNGAHEQPAIEAELHVGGPRGLGTGSGNMLTDVRCRDEYFSQRYGVIGQEVKRQVICDRR